VQERNSANTPTVTYTRGRDLSGSPAGAGGIGGLLARSHGYSGGNWASHHAYHADGNGNVTALADGAGALQASYRYDPYGRYLAGGGPLASANLLRFSSKPWVGFAGSATSGLYYYGYRFYDPYLQRWVNRDPIGEIGGINLYRFTDNNPLNLSDAHGQFIVPIKLACCVPCFLLIGWEIYDAITDACVGKTGTDLARCVVNHIFDPGCITEAVVWGFTEGKSPREILDEVGCCFQQDALKTTRDFAKVVTCACCLGRLLGEKVPQMPSPRVPVPKPTIR
jgi:RHS repeat-associated protein